MTADVMIGFEVRGDRRGMLLITCVVVTVAVGAAAAAAATSFLSRQQLLLFARNRAAVDSCYGSIRGWSHNTDPSCVLRCVRTTCDYTLGFGGWSHGFLVLRYGKEDSRGRLFVCEFL